MFKKYMCTVHRNCYLVPFLEKLLASNNIKPDSHIYACNIR